MTNPDHHRDRTGELPDPDREQGLAAAEADVARATAALRQTVEGWCLVQPDPVERARVAQLALSHLEATRDSLLRAAVEEGHAAPEVARRVGVRPAIVVMACARKG